MTDLSKARLYERYATTHAGRKDFSSERLLFRREVQPHLPAGPVETQVIVDLGCGQGRLVEQLVEHGYRSAWGVDISPEQVEIAQAAGIANVECGDYRELLGRFSGDVAAVVATDFLEHFPKGDVLTVFDEVRKALTPGGVFIVRSPNGTSPFFGNYQFSDITHETVLTPRSFSQLASTAGFSRSTAHPCAPIAHGAKSAARAMIWRGAAGLMRLALAAETGETDHIVTQNFVGVATS